LQQARQFRCGNFSVVGPVKGPKGRLGHKRLLCGSCRCSLCRPRKLKRVRSRIAEIASERKLLRFVTLTLDPKRIPEGTRSDRYLRDTWRKMRVLLARRFGGSIDFVGVLEFQKSGLAHLHVLIGVYIPQGWLSEAWQSVGGGRIVDIRYVDVHRVAGYLTSYLTGEKVLHTVSLLPLRARIFSCSRSIAFWGKREKTDWLLCRRSLDELRERAQAVERERWEIIEDSQGSTLEILMYFESPPIQLVADAVGTFHLLRAIVAARA
jgi:hypothetical protein